MKSRLITILGFSLIALLLTACPPTTQIPQLPTIKTTVIIEEDLASPTPDLGQAPGPEIDYSMYPPGTVFYTNEDGTQAHTRIVPELSQPEWDAPDFPKGFNTTLHAGHWKKFLLGPASQELGYLVDVSPEGASTEGAEVVTLVMPEYDGERWVDVLWLFQPMPAPALPVYVQVYTTRGWPIAYHDWLSLDPGVWQGYTFDPSSQQGAYVVEVSPQNEGERGDTLQRTMINPEFPGGWQEVLRIQTLPDQSPMRADVAIYRTPLAFLKVTTSPPLQPGQWYTGILGPSTDQTAYVMEVTPLSKTDNQVESYGVLPVYLDGAWRDAFRVRIPADRPPMEVNLRVYAVTPGSRPDQVGQIPSKTPDQFATEWAAYIFDTPTAAQPAATATPIVPNLAGCPGALPSRLQIGQSGTVSLEPPVANRVRSEPDREAKVLGQMMPGEKFTILDGPRCADGWTWWFVRSRAQELEGWTSEGEAETYWLQPVTTPTVTPTRPVVLPSITPAKPTVTNIPAPTSTPVITGAGSLSPRAASLKLHLTGNAWSGIFLGETNYPWGYLVDVSPLEPAKDGDHIEIYFETRYEGAQWLDYLFVGLPHEGSELDVQVDIYITQDWMVANQGKMILPTAKWQQFYLGKTSKEAAYILDVNPLQPSANASGITLFPVIPEYSDGIWWDMERFGLTIGPQPVEVQVTAYRAPDLSFSTFEMHLEPGAWHGIGLGPASQEQAYLVEVDPLTAGKEGYRLERVAVQPEFDGTSWNDVLRVMLPQGQPAMDVRVKVYTLKP